MSTDTGRSHWLLAPASASDASLPVPLGDVTALLEQVGRSSASSDEVAGQLLHLLGRHVPLAQCTIFSFQGRSRPRIVGFGDRARTGALPMISQDYSERFYPLDGAQRVMQAELARQQRDPRLPRASGCTASAPAMSAIPSTDMSAMGCRAWWSGSRC